MDQGTERVVEQARVRSRERRILDNKRCPQAREREDIKLTVNKGKGHETNVPEFLKNVIEAPCVSSI